LIQASMYPGMSEGHTEGVLHEHLFSLEK